MHGQVRKILIAALVCLLQACVKDRPGPVVATTARGNVYVVCEGSLSNGNATLYNYNPATDSAYGDVYAAVNHQPLGDVFQSMTRMGDSLYLCINNSDKIIVLNAADKTLAGTISIPKPRYMQQVAADRAYVSTLFSHDVYVINPRTLQVIQTITMPYENVERMCATQGSIILCPWDTLCSKVYKLDALTGAQQQAINIAGNAPHSVLMDREQMLWVMSGNVTRGRTAALTRIDPSTGNVLRSYTFPATADPIKPVFNASRDTLYYIQVKYDGSNADNGIYRMGIHEASLPAVPLIAAAKYQYFWALGTEPATGNIYVGDPKGFVQKGSVSVYRPDGSQVTTFATGLGPGEFYFEE